MSDFHEQLRQLQFMASHVNSQEVYLYVNGGVLHALLISGCSAPFILPHGYVTRYLVECLYMIIFSPIAFFLALFISPWTETVSKDVLEEQTIYMRVYMYI